MAEKSLLSRYQPLAGYFEPEAKTFSLYKGPVLSHTKGILSTLNTR